MRWNVWRESAARKKWGWNVWRESAGKKFDGMLEGKLLMESVLGSLEGNCW